MFTKEQQELYDKQTDEVKICCQWLDSQIRTRSIRPIYAKVQLIENWAGSYISSEDFITALKLLGFRWTYAGDELYTCNIKKGLVYPSITRLLDIDDIGLQNDCASLRQYKVFEDTGKHIPQFSSWDKTVCNEFQDEQFTYLSKLKSQKKEDIVDAPA